MGDKANILLVDDESNIRFVIARTLEPLYNVTAVATGQEALELVLTSEFDLTLLDIYLPDISGLDILEAIHKKQPDMAIIMLTGFSDVDSAVFSMRNGALNYLQKPASKEEILNSVENGLAQARSERQRKAILLKARQMLESGLHQLDEIMPDQPNLPTEAKTDTESVDPDRFVQKGPLLIDIYRRKATLNEELLDLTAGEYDLLYCLAKQAPQVLNHQELVQQTRGFECSLSEARELIRWQVYLLRQKIEIDPTNPQYILNIRGRGYMWAAA